MILIAGAGLAGLSASFHLGKREHRIVEREARPGGLCRSEERGGYPFDYGGHLLHLRGDYVRGLAHDLLGDKLIAHQRRSSILSRGVITPYPFQANTYGLPAEVVRDCLLGFIEARARELIRSAPPTNFHDFILDAFGQGFAGHFFFPFNQKFFKTDLHNIALDWTGWSIPRPTLREVINGALGLQEKKFGYNAEFFYPRGGIEELPKALEQALPVKVECGVELVKVIPAERRAALSTGEEVVFERLIATAPLDRIVAMTEGAPDEIIEAGKSLRVLSVICVNLGVTGPPLTDQHWLYLPEPAHPFHRVGVYSNFMEAGPGRNSLYLELTAPGPITAGAEEVRVIADGAAAAFRELPLFKQGEHRIEVTDVMVIPYGYVLHDHARKEAVDLILNWLGRFGIVAAGRYGRWEYSTMEDAILEGRDAALE